MRLRFVLLLSFVPACSFVAAVDPATDAAPGPGPIAFAKRCAECVATNCAAEANACAVSTSCGPLGRCLAALPPDDVSGRGACEGDHSGVLDDEAFRALDRCLRTQCLDGCLGRGGIFAAYPPACTTCLEAPGECGDAMAACIADGRCERVFRGCYGERRPDPARIARCDSDPAIVSPVTDALQACASTCAPACGAPDLGCVGQYSWPKPDPAQRTFSFAIGTHVFGVGTDLPAAGATVEVCTSPNLCDAATRTTIGEDGVLSLVLARNAATGFVGLVRLSGQANGKDVMLEHVFPGAPIYDDLHNPDRALVVLIERAAFDLVTAIVGAVPDDALGHLLVGVGDCTAGPAPGPQLEINATSWVDNQSEPARSTRIWYFGGTDGIGPSGGGWVLNVREGCAEITARTAGAVTHRARAYVVANAISQVFLFPLTTDGETAFDCVPGQR